MNNASFFYPEWPLPENVKSVITTNLGGHSEGAYESFNLAHHVGDLRDHVNANRKTLAEYVPGKINWLQQTHSCDLVNASSEPGSEVPPKADGSISCIPKAPCVVMTADCLPVLLSCKNGSQVAAVHAGWRGLANGILSNAIGRMNIEGKDLTVFLGPAISQKYFQVGLDVVEAFKNAQKTRAYSENIEKSFVADEANPGKYFLDLYQVARSELMGLGVESIYGGNFCTFSENRFYSFRQKKNTGRFASLIWKV